MGKDNGMEAREAGNRREGAERERSKGERRIGPGLRATRNVGKTRRENGVRVIGDAAWCAVVAYLLCAVGAHDTDGVADKRGSCRYKAQ